MIVLNQVNDPLLSNVIKQNNVLLLELTTYASNDTLTQTEGRLVDKYKTHIERISSLKARMDNLRRILKEQKVELENLKKDIENGSGKRDLYDENLNFEQKKFRLIEKEINSIRRKKTDLLNIIATFKIKIRELNQNFKSKQITK